MIGISMFSIMSNLRGEASNAGTTSREESRSYEVASMNINVDMVEMICTGHVPRQVIHPEENPRENRTNNAEKIELAKWKLVEIFKVTKSIRQN